jgi:hypothetical protein
VEQQELYHETLTEALQAVVSALGGKKAVATLLWPEKPADESARLLADCLNPDRAARLDPDRLVFLLRLARAKSCHTAIAWICEASGYAPPVPVEPDDQQAELQRQFIQAMGRAEALVDRMARLNIGAIQSRETRR